MNAAQAFVESRSVSDWSESELLERLLCRDEAAWAEFFRRYRSLIYGCIYKVTQKHAPTLSLADLDDIYGEVCVALLRNDMHRLRCFDASRGNRLGTWIGLLTSNATYDYLRGPLRRHNLEAADEALSELNMPPCSAPTPVERTIHRQRWSQFRRVLSQFTLKDQMFVDLYFAQGLDAAMVAERMAINLKTVYSKKHKLRQHLRRSIRSQTTTAAALLDLALPA